LVCQIPKSRLVAQQKAAQIELDIASGNFDVTLSKYKAPKTTSVKQKEVTVVQLFEQFTSTQSKAKELHTGSLCRYTATLKHLERYFPSKPAELIDQNDTEGFAQYILDW
jgi:integrase